MPPTDIKTTASSPHLHRFFFFSTPSHLPIHISLTHITHTRSLTKGAGTSPLSLVRSDVTHNHPSSISFWTTNTSPLPKLKHTHHTVFKLYNVVISVLAKADRHLLTLSEKSGATFKLKCLWQEWDHTVTELGGTTFLKPVAIGCSKIWITANYDLTLENMYLVIIDANLPVISLFEKHI